MTLQKKRLSQQNDLADLNGPEIANKAVHWKVFHWKIFSNKSIAQRELPNEQQERPIRKLQEKMTI